MEDSLKESLFSLERKFWTGDARHYERNVDESCLVAFTGMAGLFSNADLAATVKDGNRWRELDLNLKGMAQPVPDVVMMTYDASAVRENGDRYFALVSTGYVKRADGWKMMFHAQTPVDKKDDG